MKIISELNKIYKARIYNWIGLCKLIEFNSDKAPQKIVQNCSLFKM